MTQSPFGARLKLARGVAPNPRRTGGGYEVGLRRIQADQFGTGTLPTNRSVYRCIYEAARGHEGVEMVLHAADISVDDPLDNSPVLEEMEAEIGDDTLYVYRLVTDAWVATPLLQALEQAAQLPESSENSNQAFWSVFARVTGASVSGVIRFAAYGIS